MKFKTAIEQVRRHKFYITYAEFGEKLHITEAAVKKRIERKSDLKYDETFILAEGFQLPVRLFFNEEDIPDTVPVEYYENTKIRLERNPNMPKYYMDFEIAYKYNRYFNKDNFKIICMRGDKLAGGGLWCRDGDVLLIDTSKTDISSPGLYAYECENGNYVAMAYIEKLPDGAVFKYSNPASEEVRSQEYLDKVKFKVIGRILKNLFFFA